MLGIANINEFYDKLETRNTSFLQRMNKREKTDSFVKEFEIALKYDLLD